MLTRVLRDLVRSTWARLEVALGDAVVDLQLCAGATEVELARAEAALGEPLPDEYRAWLAIANGQPAGYDHLALSLLPNGSWFATLDRVVEQRARERAYFEDTYDVSHAQDRDRVLSFIFHPDRLTIAGNAYFDQDNTFLDFVPGFAGVPGQLVQFLNECDMAVIGPDGLAAYFDRLAALLESGAIVPGRADELRMLVDADTGVADWAWRVRGDKRPRRR